MDVRFRLIKTTGIALGLMLMAVVLSGPHARAETKATATTASSSEPWSQWISAHNQDHPLTGRIWSTRTRSFVSQSDLIFALQSASYLLLGEKHDNADHHRLQAWVIENLAQEGDHVVFEMVPERLNKTLVETWANGAKDEELASALEWEKRGWYGFDIYAPIFQAMRQTGAMPRAGDSDKAAIRKVSREGYASVMDEARALRLALSQPMPGRYVREMRRAIVDGHCGMIESKSTDPFINVQRLRDAFMADGLIGEPSTEVQDGARSKRAFLIAGTGHIRRDYGVPWYLRIRGESANDAIALRFAETQAEETSPRDYYEISGMGAPIYDYIWFTPKVEMIDPCEKYAEQLEKMKSHGKN